MCNYDGCVYEYLLAFNYKCNYCKILDNDVFTEWNHASNLLILLAWKYSHRKSETPWVRINSFYESARLSVGRILDNFQQNHQIELYFGILFWSRKSRDKFVNQPNPTKMIKIGAVFVFLKKLYRKIKNFHTGFW